MKLIYPVFALLYIVTGCRQPGNIMDISVELTNNPGNQLVSLATIDYNSTALQLDTSLLTGSTATGRLTTTLNEPGLYYLLFQNNNRPILFVNDLPEITIQANWNNLSDYRISSPGSNTLKKLLTNTNTYLKMADSLEVGAHLQSFSDSIRHNYARQKVQKLEELKAFLKAFSDTTTLAPVALYALGLLQQQEADSSLLKPAIQRLLQRFPLNESIKKIGNSYFSKLKREAHLLLPGQKAPEISLPDSSGQILSLSSYTGKFTLVDFWASWCPNCRTENPQIVSAYNTYKHKNFSVLGVSLDKEKNAWLQAIHKDSLSWQHVSDLKEWQSPVVDRYGIEALPFNVLVDTAGNIVAVNLHGTALQNKLAEVLK